MEQVRRTAAEGQAEGRAESEGAVCTQDPGHPEGAPLLGATDEELCSSLDRWMAENMECPMMEWHHDAPFDADPPSYNALFCVTPGGSSTAYADAGAAYRNLPPTLQRQADSAVCVYRRSLSFGAERLGLPALPKRLVQQSMSSVRSHPL